MSEKFPASQDEADRRIAACVNAFEGIPTDRIEGKDLGEILAGELRLNGAGPRADGGFCFEFSGGVCHLMAEAYAEQFRQSGAINYLELLFHHSDIGPLTITMQRVEGLTPAQKLAQAEAQRDSLQQKLEQAEGDAQVGLQLSERLARQLDEAKQKLDALAAENARMLEDYRDIPEMRRIGAPLAPATNAYLDSVRAEGVEMLAKVMEENGYHSVSVGAKVFAAQLRAGQEAK